MGNSKLSLDSMYDSSFFISMQKLNDLMPWLDKLPDICKKD